MSLRFGEKFQISEALQGLFMVTKVKLLGKLCLNVLWL